MRKTNKITAIFALLAAALTVGCTGQFEEYNTNQHEATEEQMEQDNLKTGAFFRQLQRSVMVFNDGKYDDGAYQLQQNLLADSYAGYLAPTITDQDGVHAGAYRMAPEKWINAMFNYTFESAMPAWKSMVDAANELDQPEVAAMATIVKVTAMHRTTDYYGPIPYLSFGNGQINNDYDSQEDIYHKFFEELDEAIDVLTTLLEGNSNAMVLTTYDYIYGGSVRSWVKFANSLRLRLAMRVVYADAELAQTEAEKSIANPVGVMTDASDIASLKHSESLVYRHPLYVINVEFNDADTQMGASIDAYMNGYNDPRLSAYFKNPATGGPRAGEYCGVRNGIVTTTWDNFKNPSGLVSSPAHTANSELVWMTASEAYFLRAEGALRGWSMNGTAQELYEQGIATSFAEHSAGSAADYIANAKGGTFSFLDNTRETSTYSKLTNIPAVAWSANASFEQNLERIMIQKWIAMYPNGPEGWAEARRTGYPRLVPVNENLSDGAVGNEELIRRIVFPYSEQTNNPSGKAVGVSLLHGPDNAGTHLWWDCK